MVSAKSSFDDEAGHLGMRGCRTEEKEARRVGMGTSPSPPLSAPLSPSVLFGGSSSPRYRSDYGACEQGNTTGKLSAKVPPPPPKVLRIFTQSTATRAGRYSRDFCLR